MTAIDAADALTSGNHHMIFVQFHRLRRCWNDVMYETAAEPGFAGARDGEIRRYPEIAIARQQIQPP